MPGYQAVPGNPPPTPGYRATPGYPYQGYPQAGGYPQAPGQPAGGYPGTPAYPAATGYPGASAYPPGPGHPAAPGYPGYGPIKPTATPDGVPLAGLGNRLGAKIIDELLIGAVVFLLSLPLLINFFHEFVDYMNQVQQDARNGTPVSPFGMYSQTGFLQFIVMFGVLNLALNGAYNVVLVHLKGATFGKMLVGVRVRPWNVEQHPTWGQALRRWLSGEFVGAFGGMIPFVGSFIGLYWLIDYLWPVWDDRKQALHDKWPGTIVVAQK
jgi:uncharacterized RDD family membrane protein YckC